MCGGQKCTMIGHVRYYLVANDSNPHLAANLRLVHDEEGAKALGIDGTQQVEEAHAVIREVLKILRNHLERAREERLEDLGHVGGNAAATFRITIRNQDKKTTNRIRIKNYN
jgi:hypothetical protein